VAVWWPFIWHAGGDIEAAERLDHVSYRDWERAGFLEISDGDTIDYSAVEACIAWAKQTFDLRMVGFDPYLSRTITQRLTPIVDCVEIPQDMRNLSPAMKEIDVSVRRHEMLHVHNTCFRWTFGNVRCAVDGNLNMKPMKNKSPGRIDPAVALIIAVAVWMIARNQKPDLGDRIASGSWSM
jgi:phage terminase large subunit-like protein